MDLRRRIRRKSSTLSLQRLDLSSFYYLKNLKIDISQTGEISYAIKIAKGPSSVRSANLLGCSYDECYSTYCGCPGGRADGTRTTLSVFCRIAVNTYVLPSCTFSAVDVG